MLLSPDLVLMTSAKRFSKLKRQKQYKNEADVSRKCV